jgi:hypothetical protein
MNSGWERGNGKTPLTQPSPSQSAQNVSINKLLYDANEQRLGEG